MTVSFWECLICFFLQPHRYYDKKYQVFLKMVEHQKEYSAIMNGNWATFVSEDSGPFVRHPCVFILWPVPCRYHFGMPVLSFNKNLDMHKHKWSCSCLCPDAQFIYLAVSEVLPWWQKLCKGSWDLRQTLEHHSSCGNLFILPMLAFKPDSLCFKWKNLILILYTVLG